ncbi:hypothetical protein KR093_006654, partial [Drosophila rubida]
EQRHYKVVVVGAAGGIGQPLSLLLKNNKLISELVLHDVVNVAGVAADLSHVPTNVPVSSFKGPCQIKDAVKDADLVVITAGFARQPGMDREQLFEVNAKVVRGAIQAIARNASSALIAIVTNPINSIVPMAAEYLKREHAFDPKRLFGVTTLDLIRAETFIGNFMDIDPRDVQVPVIGGHAGKTILPILSQCNPELDLEHDCKMTLIRRIQMGGDEVVEAKQGKGSATLSMAFATARFVNALLLGLDGRKAPIECAYVYSKMTEASFFSTPLSFGPCGIEKNHGLPDLDDCERVGLEKAVKGLLKSIENGIRFAHC